MSALAAVASDAVVRRELEARSIYPRTAYCDPAGAMTRRRVLRERWHHQNGGGMRRMRGLRASPSPFSSPDILDSLFTLVYVHKADVGEA